MRRNKFSLKFEWKFFFTNETLNDVMQNCVKMSVGFSGQLTCHLSSNVTHRLLTEIVLIFVCPTVFFNYSTTLYSDY